LYYNQEIKTDNMAYFTSVTAYLGWQHD